MFNVQKLAATVTVSLVAAGSLAAVGAGVAGAASGSTSHSTTSAAPHKSTLDAERRCVRRQEILQGMAAMTHRYVTGTSVYAGLAASARAGGTHRMADYWVHVVNDRHAAVVRRDVLLQARRAHYTALDDASRAC
jgi:hypothetical protein